MSDYAYLLSELAQQLVPYVPGEQPKLTNLVKLNTNENPFAPSPLVLSAIQQHLAEDAANLRLYPDPDSSILKAAMAEFYGLSSDYIFVGNGSDEVLAHVFAAFFKKRLPLLFPDITYSFYPVYGNLYEVESRQVPLTDDFSIQVEDYQIPSAGVIIANPNAPTGKLLPLASIQQLLQQNAMRVVVIDEAYIDFGGDSAVSLVKQFPNLVVTQTTSKSRSLAGMRVGCAIAQPHLIAALNRIKNSFNSYPIDRLAEVAATASYQDRDYFAQTCQQVIALRTQLVAGLTARGFSIVPSHANFVLATHNRSNALDIASYLRSHKVIVRHFATPKIANYLRITVGSAADHQALFAALDAMVVA